MVKAALIDPRRGRRVRAAPRRRSRASSTGRCRPGRGLCRSAVSVPRTRAPGRPRSAAEPPRERRAPCPDRSRTPARTPAAPAGRRAPGRRRTRCPTPPAGCGREDPRCRRTDRRDHRPPSDSAIALTVRSRRPRSCSIVAPSSAIRSSCQERSRATTRQPPNASDSSNAWPRATRATLRADAATSPPTTTSKSDVGRRSSRSRTAPPTSQAGVPSSASARSGAPALTSRRRPVTVVFARHPPRDPADHLVGDRLQSPRHVLGGLALDSGLRPIRIT